MANILIVSHWTGGDVMPFIKMGYILKSQGHDVTVFTHCIYEDKVKGQGLDFVAVDNQDEYLQMIKDFPLITDPINNLNGTTQFQSKHHGYERCMREYELISRHCNRPDTIIIFRHRSSVSALLVAEKFNLPVASVFLAPNYIAHLDLHEQLLGDVMKEEVNKIRKAIGLEDIWSWTEWMCMPKVKIGVWPSWFGDKADTEIGGLVPIGFLIEDDTQQGNFPKELSDFLERDQKPILITGGTSKMINPSFYDVSVKACALANKQAIVVIPFEEFVPEELPPNIKLFKSVPLKKLMNHVSTVIHHGGIGTASEALACGVPQIILPHMADRPDNAHRFRNLGVAKSFPEALWNPELIAKGLEETETMEFVDRCKDCSKLSHQDSPVKSLSNIIEEMIKAKNNFAIHNIKKVKEEPADNESNIDLKEKERTLSPQMKQILIEMMRHRREADGCSKGVK